MRTLHWCAVSSLMALVVSGCAVSPATRFYVLSNAKDPGDSSTTSTAKRTVGLRVSSFPVYLDRAQIVKRGSWNQLVIAEFDRWAEPLDQAFARQLAENIASLNGALDVAAFPWPHNQEMSKTVEMKVLRFEAQPDGQVALATKWKMLDATGNVNLPSRVSRILVPVSGSGYEALVKAMSLALAKLGDEVGTALSGPG